MRAIQLRSALAAIAIGLLLPVHGWAQQIRIIDCAEQYSYSWELAGCQEFDPELLYFAQVLAGRALQFAPRLPRGLNIDIWFNYSDDFNHQSRPGQPDLITIGEGMMVDMWNSYADVWDMYDQDIDDADPYADYNALVEWALYHEIGHALVDHTGYRHNDKDHEALADDFATVTMIRLYWQPGEDYVTPAELAADGLYFLSIPYDQRAARGGSAKRNLVARQAPQKRVYNKRRGVDGNRGVHEPNPVRAWEIACLVYGSGQAPHPSYSQDNPYGPHDEDGGCSEYDYEEVVEELASYYAPAMQYD